MNESSIYAGEDFALLVSAIENDTDSKLDFGDYEIQLHLSTSRMGKKIIASTEPEQGLMIKRHDGKHLSLNVSSKISARLNEGVIWVSMVMIHRQSQVKIISETKTINVKRSKVAV